MRVQREVTLVWGSGSVPPASPQRARIEELVAACAARRARGERAGAAELVAAHPGLMPELADALQAAGLLDSAAPTDGTTTELSPTRIEGPPPPVGESFPGYEIVRQIGFGGQGVVYEAIQAHTKRKVAIKVLRPDASESRAAQVRFEREIELVARFQHPHIISIFHSGRTDDGRQFYVMDYVRGAPLQRWVRERRLTLEDTLRLFASICEAVDVAHGHGVIHRDLKPSNILVDTDGQPHVLDFGLAKRVATPVEAAVSMTQDVVGTLPYMSPEQAAGSPEDLDVRTDVYALGVQLYELLTGGFPYPVTGSISDVIRSIVETPPAPPSRRWSAATGVTQRSGRPVRAGECPLDGEVETILLKALAKERGHRYAAAGQLADDLRRYLGGEPIQARRASLTYYAWASARRGVRRHPWATVLAGLAVIAVLTQYVVAPAVYRWSSLNWQYETAINRWLSPAPAPPFEHVRVIALTDRTDVAALAQSAGLADVRPENRPSLRRLHGALLEHLADCGLRVVVSCIQFPGPSEFDPELARGVQALHERGVDFVACVGDWTVDEAGRPALSPALLALENVKAAAATGDFSGERLWSVDLLVHRPGGEPLPSLAVLAFAAHRRPGAEVYLTVSTRRQDLWLRYWTPTGAGQRTKHWLPGGDWLRLTGLWALPADDPEFGLRAGDIIGQYVFDLPSDAALAAGVLEYADVFTADGPQLRAWLAGRVAVLGDLRGQEQPYPYPGGRRVPGACGHAAAVDSILRNVAYRVPTRMQTWLIVALAVIFGGLAGGLSWGRPGRCAVWLILLTIALLFAVIAAYRVQSYLINPLVPAFALVTGGVFAALVQRQAQAGRISQPEREVAT